MLVQNILKSKPSGGVLTIVPGSTVSQAARILSEKRIGTIVISPDGEQLSGILSERDIVRELGRVGPACMENAVDSLMTREIITCSPEHTSDEVMTMMTEGRFRHMPVMEDGKMVGLISIGDVVKARLSELSMEKQALEGMIMGH